MTRPSPLTGDSFLEALVRGRGDHAFFGAVFLGREPHGAQLDYLENANATINVLPTSNRWGKTTVILQRHAHKCIYKIGAEARYLDDGLLDQRKFNRTRYHTMHTSGDWDTASLVWDDFHKVLGEWPNLRPFVTEAPKSLPPHVTWAGGAVWKFHTLGHDARGIDGNSFYLISVDEAGWIEKLKEMQDNVLRVRVADVRGQIDLNGTMKPGISRDFFQESVRAGIYTGSRDVVLDFRSTEEDELGGEGVKKIPASIRKLCREAGVSEAELGEALAEAEAAYGGDL